VQLQVVKNTLLKKAMETCDKDYNELYDVLKGNTSMMLSETANAPAKAITEFLKKNKGAEKPLFKGALVDESVYAADQLSVLENLKSKEELIGDIITLLQSPAKNVISGLQSGGNTLAGLMKTLEERAQ
jgi:large subunit ribosomal protein L10